MRYVLCRPVALRWTLMWCLLAVGETLQAVCRLEPKIWHKTCLCEALAVTLRR